MMEPHRVPPGVPLIHISEADEDPDEGTENDDVIVTKQGDTGSESLTGSVAVNVSTKSAEESGSSSAPVGGDESGFDDGDDDVFREEGELDEEEDEVPQMTTEDKKALYDAVVSGSIHVVDGLLLKPNADINMEWFGENLLMASIRAGKTPMAEWLIDNGTDPNFTKTYMHVKNPSKTDIETFTTSCRQMAYESGMSDIVDLIDEKNDLFWPFVKKRERVVHLRTMLIEDTSDDDSEEEEEVIDLCEDEEEEIRSKSSKTGTQKTCSEAARSRVGSQAPSTGGQSAAATDLPDGGDTYRQGRASCLSARSQGSGVSWGRSSRQSSRLMDRREEFDEGISSGYGTLSTVSESSHLDTQDVFSSCPSPHRYRATKSSLSRRRATQGLLAERAAPDNIVEITRRGRSRLLRELGAVEEQDSNSPHNLYSRTFQKDNHEHVLIEGDGRSRSPWTMDRSPGGSVTWHDLKSTRQSSASLRNSVSDLRPLNSTKFTRSLSSAERLTKLSMDNANSFLPMLNDIERNETMSFIKNRRVSASKNGLMQDFNNRSRRMREQMTDRVLGTDGSRKSEAGSDHVICPIPNHGRQVSPGRVRGRRSIMERCKSAPVPKFYSPAGYYRGSGAIAKLRLNSKDPILGVS